MNALILAAGRSSRMGTDKALMQIDSEFVLQHLILKLGKFCNSIYLVSGSNKKAICEALINVDLDNKAKVIHNPQTELGMFSSIFAGLKAIEENDPVLIQMVDQPFLPIKVYSKLSEYFKPAMQILQPSFKMHAGHPIIINSEFKKQILSNPKTAKLNEIIRENADDRHFLEVEDNRVLQNINTIDEFEKEREIFREN